MKCCGKKINRYLSTLTPPHKKQIFLKKNLVLFFVFFSNFDTPQLLQLLKLNYEKTADDDKRLKSSSQKPKSPQYTIPIVS
jgi:hypothetical protein